LRYLHPCIHIQVIKKYYDLRNVQFREMASISTKVILGIVPPLPSLTIGPHVTHDMPLKDIVDILDDDKVLSI
jgi:hypothetical protein